MVLPSFAFAASRDPLDRHTLNAVACGISSRKNARSLDPLPAAMQERSISKSSVSRRYGTRSTNPCFVSFLIGDAAFFIT